jgi:hypothetical protein
MNIKLNEAISTLEDRESAIAVLEEIYSNIEELKNERDRYKIKALSRKVELKKLKETTVAIVTDNYDLSYRDNRGMPQKLSKSGLDGVRMHISVSKA